MSNYTMTIRQIVASGYKLFGNYPIRDGYKEQFEEDFIKFYNDFEIGYPNVALFKEKLNARLNLIMPNYNRLYEAYEIEFNLMYNVHMEEEYTQTNEGEANGRSENQIESSNSTTTSTKQVSSDFPDSTLTDGDIASLNYASGGNITSDIVTDGGETNNTTTNGNTHNETTTYKRTQDGSSAGLPFSKAFRQYREDYLYNINQSILHDLSDLFLQVW